MGDPRELEQAKKPNALKESWTARIGTHVYTEFPLQVGKFKSLLVTVNERRDMLTTSIKTKWKLIMLSIHTLLEQNLVSLDS